MKKIFLIMVFLIFGVISMASKTAYVMVPDNYSELYVIGMDESYVKNGTEGKYEELKILDNKDDTEGYLKKNPIANNEIRIFEKDYYDGTKLLKLMTNNDKDTKIVVGYKHPIKLSESETKDTYVVLASEKIDATILKKNYNDDDIPKQEIVNFGSYDYSDFPGHEVKENVIVLGIRVGDKRTEEELEDDDISEYTIPKNIVEKFYNLPKEGSEDVILDAGINPTASSAELVIRDNENNILITMKGWETPKPGKPNQKIDIDGVVWLDDGLHQNDAIFNKNDKIIVTEDRIYLDRENGEEIKIHSGKKGPYSISFRTMTKKNTKEFSTIKIGDGEAEKLNGANDLSFNSVKDLKLEYFKKNHFDLYMNATVSSDETIEEDPPVYVVKGEGVIYETSIDMTSGKEELRKRESNIEIDILNGKGIEIKSIKE